MTPNSLTTIDLIRHGEPVGGRKYRGQIDDPLSEKGWTQMRQTVGNFSAWQHIVSSPLLRCRDFAANLAQLHDIPMSLETRLREVGFGAWEGLTAAEIGATDADLLFNFKRDPIGYRPPGAEPLADFQQRVGSAWDELVTRHERQHILVVCHAGVIRMILAHVLDMPVANAYRIQVGSAALSRIVVERRGTDSLANLVFHDGSLAKKP
jgi:alpha-ribazole phosphatase